MLDIGEVLMRATMVAMSGQAAATMTAMTGQALPGVLTMRTAETQEAACTALLVMICGHRNLDCTVMAAMRTIGKGKGIARATFLRKLRSVMPMALILAISGPPDQVGPMTPSMVKAL